MPLFKWKAKEGIRPRTPSGEKIQAQDEVPKTVHIRMVTCLTRSKVTVVQGEFSAISTSCCVHRKASSSSYPPPSPIGTVGLCFYSPLDNAHLREKLMPQRIPKGTEPLREIPCSPSLVVTLKQMAAFFSGNFLIYILECSEGSNCFQ